MTRFVLDTDIVSLLQHGHPTVAMHVGNCAPNDVATTIITVEEQLSAWYTLLRRAKTARELVPVYQRMSETIQFLSRLPVLTLTEAAADLYQGLRKQKPRTGRMDLANCFHLHCPSIDCRYQKYSRLSGHSGPPCGGLVPRVISR
jgi:tRNA(fMet)-specific endonuclease VapC